MSNFLKGAKEKAVEAKDKMKQVASPLMDRAGAKFDSLSEKLEDELSHSETGRHVLSLRSKLKQQAEEFSQEKKEMLEKWKEEKRAVLAVALSHKLKGLLDKMMNVAAVKIKDALCYSDPYQPRFVADSIEYVVDALWPDISQDLRDSILATFHPNPPIDHSQETENCRDKYVEEKCCESCVSPIFLIQPRAWILYNLMPYDRGIWRNIRSWKWILLNLMMVVPTFGIAQVSYILLFFFIKRYDEFQLVNYIATLHSLQFVSGIVASFVGLTSFYLCAVSSPSYCDDHSPREEIFTLGLFCGQLICSWLAFFFLPSSEQRGGLRYQLTKRGKAKQQQEAKQAEKSFVAALTVDVVEETYYTASLDANESHSRIFSLLIYDTVIFSLCLGLALWAIFGNLIAPESKVQNFDGSENPFNSRNWKMVTTLYMCRTLYALLQFPFLVLIVPILSSLYTRAKATGYDPRGKVVPFIGHEEKEVPYRRQKEDPPNDLEAIKKAKADAIVAAAAAASSPDSSSLGNNNNNNPSATSAASAAAGGSNLDVNLLPVSPVVSAANNNNNNHNQVQKQEEDATLLVPTIPVPHHDNSHQPQSQPQPQQQQNNFSPTSTGSGTGFQQPTW